VHAAENVGHCRQWWDYIVQTETTSGICLEPSIQCINGCCTAALVNANSYGSLSRNLLFSILVYILFLYYSSLQYFQTTYFYNFCWTHIPMTGLLRLEGPKMNTPPFPLMRHYKNERIKNNLVAITDCY
jgi:hypothetical protein